jgi:hypothetical protein
MVSSGHAFHSQGWDSGSQPSAFAVAPLEVLLRSLSPFSVHSLAGAVDGSKGGEDASGDCDNAGAARPGVGGWVLFTPNLSSLCRCSV